MGNCLCSRSSCRAKESLTNSGSCTKILVVSNYLSGGNLIMYEKLVSYAAKQLELDPSEITPDSTFESLGIDSLDIVEMIMDLESELGIELDLEDQKISTFRELADFIDARIN